MDEFKIIKLDESVPCQAWHSFKDEWEPDTCKKTAWMALITDEGHLALCEEHVTKMRAIYKRDKERDEMSEEREEYKTRNEEESKYWYAYDRKAVNGYQIRAVMRERERGEPTDVPLGIEIEGHGGSLALSYHEAKVIRRHLDAALTAVENTLQNQQAAYDEWLDERYRVNP